MKSLLLAFTLLISNLALAQIIPTPQEIAFKYQSVFMKNPEINVGALTRLLTYFDVNQTKIVNKNYVTFVDFSLDSKFPRMYLIDMRDGSRDTFLVAHGIGSDPKHTGRARIFSNTVDSHMSSLGIFYTTNEVFNGKNGISLRLIGLEKTNSNALDRAILVHGADYVAPNLDPLGLSEGCFAVDHAVAADIINKISGGSVMMSWINPSLL